VFLLALASIALAIALIISEVFFEVV